MQWRITRLIVFMLAQKTSSIRQTAHNTGSIPSRKVETDANGFEGYEAWPGS
jgi:hypothetical protein